MTSQTTCEYEVSGDESVCQIRLDFDTFDIADPTTAGACSTDYFDAVGSTGRNPPRICGSASGQHSMNNGDFQYNLLFWVDEISTL